MSIALVGLVFFGGAAGIAVYGIATEPDRSTPTVVADQFLQAALIDKDNNRIALFVCRQWNANDLLLDVWPELVPEVRVAWGDLETKSQDDKTAVVTAEVRLTVVGGSIVPRDIQAWRLDLVSEDGWRICGVSRAPSLNP